MGSRKNVEEQKRRVKQRAPGLELEDPDPQAGGEPEAAALLAESDERTDDPAVRNLKDPRVERRTSDEATPPVEQE
jgi:hypothetical protein